MKRLLSIAILVLSINVFAQIPTNGLVGYWPLNGNANDASNNGNNGIVNGATHTNDRFGVSDQSYYFSGADDIVIPADTLYTPTKGLTLCAWVNPSTKDYAHYIISRGHDAQPGWYCLDYDMYQETTFTFAFQLNFNQGSGLHIRLKSNCPVPLNTWSFITGTYDGATMKIYVDGVIKNSLPTTDSIIEFSPNINIGSHVSGMYFVKGKIDDVRIYNRALNQSEITALYNENICYQTITVTDTLVINANFTGFNPITYANTIKVYPNPTKDKITIDCGNNFSALSGYTIKITNSLSQTVYTSKVTQQSVTIDLSAWTGRGIYFVHLIDVNGSTIDIKKIILQ
jgi:hypothetical protein